MDLLIVKNENITIDLEKCIKKLNEISSSVKFKSISKNVDIEKNGKYLSLNTIINEEKLSTLTKQVGEIKFDGIIYLTNTQYDNNYFYYKIGDYMITSFYGWKYYTKLPIENGLFYFISSYIALIISGEVRHQNATGCIYDYLIDKTSIDIGMKKGYICDDCNKIIEKEIIKDGDKNKLYIDMIKILNVLSNASKSEKNVTRKDRNETLINLNWSSFEDIVANYYRNMGATVKQNFSLSGFQIDILAEDTTNSGQKIRLAVECKFYNNKIGNKIINDYSKIIDTLKNKNLVDKGILISYSGFSKEAHQVAQTTGIELLTYNDIKYKIKPNHLSNVEYLENINKIEKEKEIKIQTLPKIFVIMPFTPEFDDVYYYGILEASKSINCTCERIDKIDYAGEIVEKIYDSIKNAQLIISDVTIQNPNVYYEVGYAHALNKTVILITKDITNTAFDIKNYNHIIYKNIQDLKQKLDERLPALFFQE